MNKFLPLFLFLQYALLQLSGCSIARYPTGDISKNPKAVLMELKSIKDYEKIFSGVKTEPIPGQNTVKITMSGLKPVIGSIELGSNKNFSAKYHRSLINQAPNVFIIVEFPNGRKYTAYLDTGCPGYGILTSDIVLDNKLAVLPSGPLIQFSGVSGICYIPVLNIGPAQIKDGIAFYDEQQWQFRVLNFPIYKHSALILGRDFIKSFDYVMFDNVHKKAVFSKEGAFVPDNPQLWSSYHFFEDPNGGNTIVVKIPIAGKLFEVAFDSCGDKPGLSLSQKHWQTIEPELVVKRLRKSNVYKYQSGRKSYQKATISEISIGDKKLRNVDVIIDNEPEGYSIFSLGYFQDTTVVLDYVNKLFWIKKAK
ncbi:MAG: hypothetical protein JXA96_10565 [Sedimentisphaerales bacterium]|nr:hypothetical protein [Sedimentisphaerales bacterium]